ncbi:alpha/beta hydrolase [Chamaesiphon sp. VAR_48_metabat_135_sub]|uniref:alpha/beta fold hydrolase n=1 Tax=Chamaesiphon sp. VAR_48_metabat_135_sub TaxID=2964699 RepID=UPI00286AB7AA|nr:alpha/beta hydrolase [Chamaesiphon sp. VAR_48_metabat_135_sub]
MFPSFLPANVRQLTEPNSIESASQIQRTDIATPLLPQAIPTSYICQGTGGIPIVFLHGFDSSLLEFRRIIPIISQHTEVWAIDLLGFGFTERLPDCPFSADSIRTHLQAFWQTKIQQPIILVGVSMGGAAAIEFTLNYPEAVHKLVLIDSAGFTQPPAMGKFLIQPLGNLATKFLSSQKVRRSVSEKAYFDRSFVTADAQLCAALHLEMPNWSEALIAFTRSGGYGYLLDRLSEIQQQTLIIWGKHDRILGIEAAQKFKQNLPNSQLQWIDNCGHVPHLEMAQITAQSILDFICQ